MVEKKTISRQAAWERKRRRLRLCVRCGAKRTILKRLCLTCGDKRNKQKRVRYAKKRGEILRKAGFIK